jgi:septal ring factor EnvC (AmiA/AmiB activator)
MLFGAVVPAVRAQTMRLSQSLARLDVVRLEQGNQQKEIAGHIARLSAAREELLALQARKQALIAETRGRLADEQDRTRKLAERAQSLQQLLDGLTVERKRQEAEEAKRAKAEEEKRIALLNRPRIPFTELNGRLDYPAQGQRLRGFGDDDGFGSRSRGLFIATRPQAQVTAPADGKVEFAGEFRSYGLLLILNVGEGYHVLMAGLGTITAETGQAIRTGEPVGSMGDQPASGTLIGDRLEDRRPILYIEFRKDGGAIDPSAWWVDSRKEARG